MTVTKQEREAFNELAAASVSPTFRDQTNKLASLAREAIRTALVARDQPADGELLLRAVEARDEFHRACDPLLILDLIASAEKVTKS